MEPIIGSILEPEGLLEGDYGFHVTASDLWLTAARRGEADL